MKVDDNERGSRESTSRNREEATNTVLAHILTETHGLRTIPEIRVHGRSKVPDLTIQPSLDCPHIIFGEAKIGIGKREKDAAVKQARDWMRGQPPNAPKRLAVAICYPHEVTGGLTPPEAKDRLGRTKAIEWVVLEGCGEEWRKGDVAALAMDIRNVSSNRGDLETLLTGTIVESANMWVNDRKVATKSLSQVLNIQIVKDSDDRVLRIAMVMLANGCLLDRRLGSVWEQKRRSRLPQEAKGESSKSLLMRRWKEILKVDYKPIFEPALACLGVLPDGDETEWILKMLRGTAESCADALGALEYDVAGPIYHRLLESAQYDGSFYTTPPAAMLLARLALSRVECNWNDPEAIAQLRIVDPACGTGTLLLAALHAARDLHRTTTSDNTSIDLVHLEMVQRVLHGIDINRHAVQLAACNLTLGSPSVDYHRMPLYTAKHGVINDEGRKRAWAGSIELLLQDSPQELALGLGGRVEEKVETGSVTDEGEQFDKDVSEPFDLVIMNPPYTRNDIRNRQLGDEARKRVQDREKDIATHLSEQDPKAARAIDQTSAATFFFPLADRLLGSKKRTLATVLPTTALVASSGQAARELLASRFQVELVITTHDPTRIYFSGNTDIHESLIVATNVRDEPAPTRFVQLRRNPTNKSEALELEACLSECGDLSKWGGGREILWPSPKMKRGDWRPALFYEPSLVEAADELDGLTGESLRPLGEMAHVAPEGRRCRDAFNNDSGVTGEYALLWDHKTERQRTIQTTPDRRMRPKVGKERYAAEILWPKASRLLITNRMWLNLVRTPAVWSSERMLGSAWCPVKAKGIDKDAEWIEKAWAAWLNSTPGMIGFLVRRTKKLSYPKFSLAGLRAMPCPNPEKINDVNLQHLVDAFNAVSGEIIKPLPDMDKDSVRERLDEAAARIVRINGATLKKWRTAIAKEPTICGR